MRIKLLMLILLLLFVSNMANGQNIQWTQKKSLPRACRNGSATASNAKVYFMGGYCDSTPERFEKSNYEYNPAANTWTSKADMPTGHANFALVAIGNRIYAIGGGPFSPKNEVYWPATDSWKTLRPMMTPRQHVSCAVVDRKIYVIGGLMDVNGGRAPSDWSYRNISTKNEVYDPSADSWEERAPMPTARHGACMAAVGGKIYVIGGMGDEKDIWKTLAVVEMYDPKTDTWETKSSLPEPRDGFGITVVNGKIYVVGGFSGPAVTSTVYVYDPKSDAWSTSTEFPSMKNGSAGCAAIKKKIFVIGGCEKNYVPNSNTFEGVVIKNRRTNKQRSS